MVQNNLDTCMKYITTRIHLFFYEILKSVSGICCALNAGSNPSSSDKVLSLSGHSRIVCTDK
jgi:hypothetical protein